MVDLLVESKVRLRMVAAIQ